MKKLTTTILMALVALLATAKPVEPREALTVAQNFWSQEFKETAEFRDLTRTLGFEEIYLFERSDGKGYVVVAGDDIALPILGYSRESGFPTEGVSPSVMSWLRTYESEIRYGREHEVEIDKSVAQEWENLKEGREPASAKGVNVEPLLTSRWNQSPLYNKYCPKADGEDQAPTGCVATAMAQVMRYWKFPEHGTGSHEYDYSDRDTVHWPYGPLSADFEHTYYDWDHMPDTLSGACDSIEIEAVAVLNYHCGVALDMVYGEDGSMAFVTIEDAILFDTNIYPAHIACEVVIPQYFGYSPMTDGKLRRDYELDEWIALLQNELVAGRPIIFAGAEEEGPSAGHCFVIDGCNQRNKFHINFGWGGSYDGNFYVDALKPARYYDFNARQQAITGMCPPGMEGITTVRGAKDIKVWAGKGAINIKGENLGAVEVFDLMGRQVARESGHGESQVTLRVPANGLYVVRTEGISHKVMVR